MRRFIVLLSFLAVPMSASARTWFVDPSGGGDFTDIQPAVIAAAAGDTILLADAVYMSDEPVVVEKAITIRSQSGDPNSCIIDGTRRTNPRVGIALQVPLGSPGRLVDLGVVRCEGGGISVVGEGVVDGCVVSENGQYGIRTATRTAVKNCQVVNNNGVGILEGTGAPDIYNCRIEGNSGTGIRALGDLAVRDTKICGNRDGGIYIGGDGRSTIEVCEIVGNQTAGNGGGLTISTTSLCTLTNVTISGNTATRGGGLYVDAVGVTLTRCIVWGNCAQEEWDEIEALGAGDPLSCECCDINSQSSSGNITYDIFTIFEDPLFCSPEECPALCEGQYGLCSGSPCLPEESPCEELIGALGQGCGGCATTPTAPLSWGLIKATFR